ncbi:Hint domain-containing protein [Pseudoruegeria sp. HB172150]|uniref:Hint domain-containing protein n=1 Tax=Pseudoruegeria sp. HB172150 TaxID=2721164 RepID=UPI001551653E|nr:Hint domain-containing protein [Pseudoruegeria sp. HB172150]
MSVSNSDKNTGHSKPGSDSGHANGTEGARVYQADIDDRDQVRIDNPGGAFDDHSIATMQKYSGQDTYTQLDGTGQDAGEDVTIAYDGRGCEVDTVEVNVSDFEGNFRLHVKNMQSMDQLNLANVLSFTALDAQGNAISPTFTATNLYGHGEGGDANGDAFGDASYRLEETDDCRPAAYEVTYLHANGEEKTICLELDVAGGHRTNVNIDFADEMPPPICFAAGTGIRVQEGIKRVEDLMPGDMVLTKDHGYQPLRWIARRVLHASELARQPNLRPIRIRARAFGSTLPERDLLVSQQHRVLIGNWRCDAMFGEDELLVPAKALVNDHSVTVENGTDDVTYYHFSFDSHEIVYANGLEAESFHPGANGLSTLDNAARAELFRVFPHLERDTETFGAPARPVLRAYEARALMSD